ncbi:MAG: VPLPA-CTERM sorting domain-containing protein [Proteobacteria bacterium]|nr:VPLPA-CTERM sorting domain-containing protein [Pseudomonadota bacterium]
MGIFNLGQAAALGLAIAAGAAPAMAATINEGSFPGGDFSGSATAPTLIGNGFDTITGTIGSDDDILAFTGMTSGAQQVTLSFAAPNGIDWSYASGGSIYYSTQPFQWNWDGTFAGSFMTALWQPTSSVTINLGSGFAGALYLALYSWGNAGSYSIGVPGNAPPAVPLPAPVLLLGGAIAGLGALRRKAKRAAA